MTLGSTSTPTFERFALEFADSPIHVQTGGNESSVT
jgi:hypothetical protein